MYIYIKIHYEGGNPVVLAACDEDLIGKVMKEGDIILDVSVDFFKGFKVQVDELPQYLESVMSAILIGENVVSKAIKSGYVHPETVLRVNNVPYAHFIKI